MYLLEQQFIPLLVWWLSILFNSDILNFVSFLKIIIIFSEELLSLTEALQ